MSGKPWVACGVALVTTNAPVKAEELACSVDGFKTWPIHQLITRAIRASGASSLPCASAEDPGYWPIAITRKDTVLVGCVYGQGNVYNNALYAFSLTTRHWASLGAYPTIPNQTLASSASQTIAYTTTGDTSVLWSYPYNLDFAPETDPLFTTGYAS